MCRWPLLLLWGLLPGAAAGGSGRPLPHRTLLDPEGKYWLNWGPQGGRLAFRLEVRTAGYVGFGFSPTGAMAAADIVVGGVAHGRPYLQVSGAESFSACCLAVKGRGSQNFPLITAILAPPGQWVGSATSSEK
uniref:DOMON domain-containing protein n=1 Tax=Sus scrofa TaxID=9823 RepID=A0A8D1Y2D3_PIG